MACAQLPLGYAAASSREHNIEVPDLVEHSSEIFDCTGVEPMCVAKDSVFRVLAAARVEALQEPQ
jgi:hypothetical protein